jgi:hypothetical protein
MTPGRQAQAGKIARAKNSSRNSRACRPKTPGSLTCCALITRARQARAGYAGRPVARYAKYSHFRAFAPKVRLFRSLFRGRTDVYPLRWESRNSGKSGYAPACANEWRAGICEKPRIRCADCAHRVLLPLGDQVIYAHLAGDHTVGLYPLMPDGTCYLLAVDFDEEGWRDDAMAFRQSCDELGVPVALEISRSGTHTCYSIPCSLPAPTSADIASTHISANQSVAATVAMRECC